MSDRVVVAHSDHGMVATRHDPRVAAAIDHVVAEHGYRIGGAGHKPPLSRHRHSVLARAMAAG